MRKRIKIGSIILALAGVLISCYGIWTHREVGNFVASSDYVAEPSPIHPDNLMIKNIMGFYQRDLQAGATMLTMAVFVLFAAGIVMTAWGLYNLFVRDT